MKTTKIEVFPTRSTVQALDAIKFDISTPFWLYAIDTDIRNDDYSSPINLDFIHLISLEKREEFIILLCAELNKLKISFRRTMQKSSEFNMINNKEE